MPTAQNTLYTTPKAPLPSSAPILRSTSLTILNLAVFGLTLEGRNGSLSSMPVSTMVIFTAVSLARARLRQCQTRIMSRTMTKNVNTTTALSINGICSESLLQRKRNTKPPDKNWIYSFYVEMDLQFGSHSDVVGRTIGVWIVLCIDFVRCEWRAHWTGTVERRTVVGWNIIGLPNQIRKRRLAREGKLGLSGRGKQSRRQGAGVTYLEYFEMSTGLALRRIRAVTSST